MSINVYWTIDHSKALGSLRIERPELVLKSKENMSSQKYNGCPAFTDYFHNVYGWKSLYTYNFEDTGHGYASTMHNQDFMDRYISMRSADDKLFSIKQHCLFMTDETSLKLSQEHPYFEDNKFTSKCYVIPGTLDIGKYSRWLDFAFHVKDREHGFEFDEGDMIYYLRFHTKERINLKQFYVNAKLRDYLDMVDGIREFSSATAPRPLSYFYGIFKQSNLKQRILKEIKKNLIDS